MDTSPFHPTPSQRESNQFQIYNLTSTLAWFLSLPLNWQRSRRGQWMCACGRIAYSIFQLQRQCCGTKRIFICHWITIYTYRHSTSNNKNNNNNYSHCCRSSCPPSSSFFIHRCPSAKYWSLFIYWQAARRTVSCFCRHRWRSYCSFYATAKSSFISDILLSFFLNPLSTDYIQHRINACAHSEPSDLIDRYRTNTHIRIHTFTLYLLQKMPVLQMAQRSQTYYYSYT